jgi:four helix bundle protein
MLLHRSVRSAAQPVLPHLAMAGDVPTNAGGQNIRERAFEFACRVVRFCERLYEGGGVGRVMAPQLVNCSTSVAGMLEEARAAESRRDFVSKCSISLKEVREAHLRLRVCCQCEIGPPEEARSLVDEANALVSIVSAIVRNTRHNTSRAASSRSPIPNS